MSYRVVTASTNVGHARRGPELVAFLLLAAVLIPLVGLIVTSMRADRPEGVEDSNPAGADRWQGRPVLAGLVVASAYAIPVIAAVSASSIVSRFLARPHGWGSTLLTYAFLFFVSTGVLVLVERVARRLLPLGALLKLSLAFPDQAPRRFSIAQRSASVKDLQAQLAHARAHGIEDEPSRAAETILMLVGALHAHDRRTRGHAERVRALADLMADELKLPLEDRDRLRWAAMLHDVGKIHVPARILNKPGQPDAHEWDAIKRHPEEGARLAAPLAEWLGEWSLTIAQHHERWDGGGYPKGLRGDEICYGARLVGVADAFDTMTAARTYRKAVSAAAARRELTTHAGSQFDPAMVRTFLNVSIGRVRWALGPLSWVVQVPFIGWLPRAAEQVVAAGSQAAGLVGSAAGAAVIATGTISPAAPAAADAPPTPIAVDVSTTAPPPATGGSTSGSRTTTRAAGSRTAAVSPAPTAAPAPTPAPTAAASAQGNGNANTSTNGNGASTATASPAQSNKGSNTSPAATIDKATGSGWILHSKNR
jgi:putative nucleotidyltransferase with HDIG domain